MKKEKVQRSLFRKIINGVILLSIGFIVLLLILFGFSQTTTFRNMLKSTIVETVDSSLNAHLSIGEIYGSIFTSLRIKDILLTQNTDTLLKARYISIQINPIQLLLKKLYFREIKVSDFTFNLLQQPDGLWNLETLSKPAKVDITESEVHETEKSTFPFVIQINNLTFQNIKFRRQSNANLNSNSIYNTMNFDDLQIDSLDLSAKILADINKQDFQLIIENLSLKPNFKLFTLRKLSGAFQLTNNLASINKLTIKSDTTDLRIDASIHGINFFEPIAYENFRNYPVDLKVKASPFNFNDLTSFIESTNLLYGQPSLLLEANGFYGDLNIQNLNLSYGASQFNINGNVKNLNKPENLQLDLNINSPLTEYKDVLTLLPFLDLPEFQDLAMLDYQINFKGEPLNFDVDFNGNINEGKLNLSAKLNLEKKLMKYDVTFDTKNLNLFHIMEVNSLINASGKIIGEGVDPAELKADFNISMLQSKFNGYSLDSLNLICNADSRIIDLDFKTNINNSTVVVSGKMDLNNIDVPVYNLNGNFRQLDLSTFLNNDDYLSSLNLTFIANGQDLNLDEMTGVFSLEIVKSEIAHNVIDDAEITLNLLRDNLKREINLTSDFIDFNITGEFSLQKAIELLAYQSEQMTKIITSKLEELNPISRDENIVTAFEPSMADTIVNESFTFDYSFILKDFEPIARIFKLEDLGILGSGNGTVSNDSNNFSINNELKLDYFYSIDNEDLLYISDLETNLNFSRDNQSNSFDNLFGALSVSANRAVAGTTINNIEADIIFNQSKLFYNFYTEIDTLLNASFEGDMEMQPFKQTLSVNEFNINYKNLDWSNIEPVKIDIEDDSLFIHNFILAHDSANLSISGVFTGSGQQNLLINFLNVPSNIIGYYLLDKTHTNIYTHGNLSVKVKGTLEEPLIDVNFYFDDIMYSGINLGKLICDLSYNNQQTYVDMRFLDSLKSYNNPSLQVSGIVPVKFSSSDSSAFEMKDIKLKLTSENFKLNTFGNLLPSIDKPEGVFTSNIDITGDIEDLKINGLVKLQNGSFRSTLNNLDYKIGLKLNINNSLINIDSLIVGNSGGSRKKGTLKGKGYIQLAENQLENANVNISGNIALLSFQSRSVSQQVYGDLFVGSDGNWVYKYENGKSNFIGKILLKEVDLVLLPVKTGYASQREDIVYEFKVDSSKIDKEQVKFQKLVLIDNNNSEKKSLSRSANFDYNMNISIENTASLDIILSQAFNQRLEVELNGDLKYETAGEQVFSQGAFNLLSGSKLDFFKSFDAEGSIRFEDEIADPYLNITATYNSDYIDPNDPEAVAQPTAIKIRINSKFSELGEKLSASRDNIQVYIGARNIADNVPDRRYGALDAMTFILVGKFSDGLTGKDKQGIAQSVAQNAADSFLGQTLTSLINAEVGNVISDIQLSTSGTYTRFNISGRIQNVRYSVGGTEQVFQNFNRANLRVEYLFNPNFLIRIERKDPIIQSTNLEDKINEIALKYSFIF